MSQEIQSNAVEKQHLRGEFKLSPEARAAVEDIWEAIKTRCVVTENLFFHLFSFPPQEKVNPERVAYLQRYVNIVVRQWIAGNVKNRGLKSLENIKKQIVSGNGRITFSASMLDHEISHTFVALMRTSRKLATDAVPLFVKEGAIHRILGETISYGQRNTDHGIDEQLAFHLQNTQEIEDDVKASNTKEEFIARMRKKCFSSISAEELFKKSEYKWLVTELTNLYSIFKENGTISSSEGMFKFFVKITRPYLENVGQGLLEDIRV